MKTTLKYIAFGIMLLASSMASAYTYKIDITNLTDFIGGHGQLVNQEFSGEYLVTGVGYESDKTNLFWSGSRSLFASGMIPDGEWCCTVNWDNEGAGFWTKNDSKWEGPSDNFQVFQLTSVWHPYGDDLTFHPGTFILGLGDGGGDGDYDDLIVAMKSAAVPIPAAVILFASGLVGLFGVSRKVNK